MTVTRVALPIPTQRTRPVDLRLTPGQLDAALRSAGWPRWSGRSANCPIHLAPLTPAARARARELGIAVADRCLMVSFSDVGLHAADWRELSREIADVAPDVADEIRRLDLVHVETDTDLRVPIARAWYLLGVGVGE